VSPATKKKAEPRRVGRVFIPESIEAWSRGGPQAAKLRAELPRSGPDARALPDRIGIAGADLWWLARTGGVAGRLSPICAVCEKSVEGPNGYVLVNGFSICPEHEADLS
jgi:hypothetical protein